MIARLFFAALFSGAFATKEVGDFLYGNAIAQDKFSDEETIRRLTEEAAEKARQIVVRAENIEKEFSSMTKDRFDSLMWQATEVKSELQKVIKDTVFKAMEKNKGLDTYRCIAERGQEGNKRVDVTGKRIPADTQEVLENHTISVMPFKYVVKEFYEFVEFFYQTKSQELKKATTEAARKKVLKDVVDKMNLVQSILENISRQVTDVKYKFFEDYIHYAFGVSNTLRRIQGEESEKIKKCLV